MDEATSSEINTSSDEPHTKKKPLLRCLHKSETCQDKSCETIIDCTNPELSSHCYAFIDHNGAGSNSNSTNSTGQSNLEIVVADCWSGGDECKPPIDVLKKITNASAYQLPMALHDPAIQQKCISYSTSHLKGSYWQNFNRSFCCCSTPLCNQELVYFNEPNPHEIVAQNSNPKVSPGNRIYPTSANIADYESRSGLNYTIINTGLFTGVLSLLLICLFLLSFSIVYFMYKKKLICKSKLSLPAIFFRKRSNSCTNSANDPNNNINSTALMEPLITPLTLPPLSTSQNEHARLG